MMPTVKRVPDLVYGEVPGYRPLELDLYLPEAAAPVPVIVHVHGGGWRRGTRRVPLPRLGAGFYDGLAAQGFAVAAIGSAARRVSRRPWRTSAPRSAGSGSTPPSTGWTRDACLPGATRRAASSR